MLLINLPSCPALLVTTPHSFALPILSSMLLVPHLLRRASIRLSHLSVAPGHHIFPTRQLASSGSGHPSWRIPPMSPRILAVSRPLSFCLTFLNSPTSASLKFLPLASNRARPHSSNRPAFYFPLHPFYTSLMRFHCTSHHPNPLPPSPLCPLPSVLFPPAHCITSRPRLVSLRPLHAHALLATLPRSFVPPSNSTLIPTPPPRILNSALYPRIPSSFPISHSPHPVHFHSAPHSQCGTSTPRAREIQQDGTRSPHRRRTSSIRRLRTCVPTGCPTCKFVVLYIISPSSLSPVAR